MSYRLKKDIALRPSSISPQKYKNISKKLESEIYTQPLWTEAKKENT